MTSKEALKSMCNHCEKLSIRGGFIGCPYRCISNDYCEEFETIKKDLEILEQLETLKKYYPSFKEFLDEMFEKGYNADLKKVKDWLEDENNK